MKSGFILILAALLALATSAVIDLPPPDEGQDRSGELLRWPTYKPAWDSRSPYINKFEVKGNVAKRISKEAQRYQILVNALPCQTKTKVSFKVKSYGGKEHGLFFGIINENRYSEKSSEGVYDDTCALYSTPAGNQGNIYMNGNEVAAWNDNWFVPEGGIVDLEVDLSLGYITFTNRATSTVKKIFLPS